MSTLSDFAPLEAGIKGGPQKGDNSQAFPPEKERKSFDRARTNLVNFELYGVLKEDRRHPRFIAKGFGERGQGQNKGRSVFEGGE